MELKIPSLRTGTYLPSFLARRRSVEKALSAVIGEAYVHGISTRSMVDLVKVMGGAGLSKSHISRLCEEIDEHVDALLEYPIERLNREIWRRSDVVRIFHNEVAIRRFVGAFLMEQTKKWRFKRGSYMMMKTLASIFDDLLVRLPYA